MATSKAKLTFSAVMPAKNEPDLRTKFENIDLANAYNWYNYFCDSLKAKEYLIHYLKDIKYPKEKIDAVKFVPENQFINSLGWNARILTLGGNLPDGYQNRMMNKLEGLISKQATVPESVPEIKISIQDRTREKIGAYIASIEDELDKKYTDINYEFNMYEWLSKNEVKPLVARAIADYYIPLYNELIDVLGDGDQEIKEGYRNIPKKNLVISFKFIESIVNDSETFASNVKKSVTKPRAKKPKSSIQLVSKIKYKESDDKYKIKSVRPVDIIGSEQMWVFNTKTRWLGVYKSSGPTGLLVKGTKILGYDTTTSIAKKLRKPEQHLTNVSQFTKSQLKKLLDDIIAKPKELNGRINSDTVLLRVTK